MGYSWQIKPDDSMSLPFLTYSPSNIIYKTIGEIKNYLTAKGYNAALLTWNSRGGYNGYMIVTHFGNINSDLHLATDVYFGKSNYTIGYPKPSSSSIEQTWMFYVYNDGSGIVNQTGSTWNSFVETKTVDGITYWTPKNPSSEHPPIYVTTYDGNIYYHGDVPSSWRNITLNLNWGSAFQCEITDFNLLNLTSWPDDISSYVQAPTGKNADFSGGTMFGSSPNYVSGRRDGTSITVYMDVYMQGYSHFAYGNENLANSQRWGFVAAVDDVSQKGFFAMLIKDSGFSRVSFWAGTSPPSLNHTWRNGMYALLIGSEHIYNWQSVTYIGNYLLSNILNINNGEPVNNVSVQGNLSLASQTAVDSLISEVVLDMSKVKVTYSIPNGTYSYIKLVYKRGSVPTSVSDGTAITITQASTEQIIDGIADGGTYWFVIFTDVSKSLPKSITTEQTIIHILNARAEDEFINHGYYYEEPSVSGTMGYYDSTDDEMYFRWNAKLIYYIGPNSADIKRASKIIISGCARLTGRAWVDVMSISFSEYTNPLDAMLGYGWDESNFDMFKINNHSFLSGEGILNNLYDVDSDLHDIRFELSLNHSGNITIPTHLNIYVDNNLYRQTDITGESWNFGGGHERIEINIMAQSWVRSFGMDLVF